MKLDKISLRREMYVSIMSVQNFLHQQRMKRVNLKKLYIAYNSRKEHHWKQKKGEQFNIIFVIKPT